MCVCNNNLSRLQPDDFSYFLRSTFYTRMYYTRGYVLKWLRINLYAAVIIYSTLILFFFLPPQPVFNRSNFILIFTSPHTNDSWFFFNSNPRYIYQFRVKRTIYNCYRTCWRYVRFKNVPEKYWTEFKNNHIDMLAWFEFRLLALHWELLRGG